MAYNALLITAGSRLEQCSMNTPGQGTPTPALAGWRAGGTWPGQEGHHNPQQPHVSPGADPWHLAQVKVRIKLERVDEDLRSGVMDSRGGEVWRHGVSEVE